MTPRERGVVAAVLLLIALLVAADVASDLRQGASAWHVLLEVLAGGLAVTTPAAAAQTLAIHQQAFDTPELRDAWQRVIAMVVQPGVDFDHSSVHEYDAAAASELADFLEEIGEGEGD